MLSRWFHRYPYGMSVALAACVLAATALLILPRLDGVEIVGARLLGDAPAAAGRVVVDVEVAYRLSSAPGGVLVLSGLPDAGPQARAEIALAAGSGKRHARLLLATGPELTIAVSLRPSGSDDGWLGALQARRRTALHRVPQGGD